MTVELSEAERTVLRAALEVYLSNLREEIVKTEKYEWRQRLHEEADTLGRIMERLRLRPT